VTDVNYGYLTKCTLGCNHVGGLVTITDRVESPDKQLQQSHNHRNSTRRVEHGTAQDIINGCGSMLDLGVSDSGRWNCRQWWRIPVAIQHRDGNHWREWDSWLSDKSIQTKHHWRQRMTACIHSQQIILLPTTYILTPVASEAIYISGGPFSSAKC